MSQTAHTLRGAPPPRVDVLDNPAQAPDRSRADGRAAAIARTLANPLALCSAALGLFTFAIRLADAGQQSAYMDEGTNVLTGRMLIEQHTVYAEILNWAYGSYLWPLAAGLADELGGLGLVRAVTAMCGVLMVLATAVTAGRMAPSRLSREQRWAVALVAGGIMALAPTAIAVSRFGTYDALAGAGFMLGTMLLLPSGQRTSALALVAAAALLFVAFLAKYLVAVYFPLVCAYVVLAPLVAKRRPVRGGERTLAARISEWLQSVTPGIRDALHNLVWFVIPLTALCVGYLVVFLGPLLTLLTSSLRYSDLKSPDPLTEYVLNRPEIWLLAACAAFGWRFASWRGRLVALAGTTVIAAFQFEARPDFDFWKHSIYVMYFLAPLAALNWLRIPQDTGTWRVLNIVGAAATAIAGWSPVVQQANRLIDFYPNLNPSIPAISDNLADAGLVLTDDTALRYYLYPAMSTDRVVGPFFFTYQGQSGIDSYRSAIADRFFDAIVLDGGVTPQGNAIRDQLGPTIESTYQRVYSRTDAGFSVDVYRPVLPRSSIGPEDNQLSWTEVHTFDTGTDGWGAHPDNADWQPGQQISAAETPSWSGHTSLAFSPTPDSSIVSIRRPGSVTRMRARVFLVPTDGSTSPVRIGLIGFDNNWQWHDDGYRWVVPPGTWTTVTWNVSAPGDYEEVGLKFPAGVSTAYVASFEVDP